MSDKERAVNHEKERERENTLYRETEGKRMSDKERAVNHEREREHII